MNRVVCIGTADKVIVAPPFAQSTADEALDVDAVTVNLVAEYPDRSEESSKFRD